MRHRSIKPLLRKKLVSVFGLDVLANLGIGAESHQVLSSGQHLDETHTPSGGVEVISAKFPNGKSKPWLTTTMVYLLVFGQRPFGLHLLDVAPLVGDTANKGTHWMSTFAPVVPRLRVLVAGEDKQFGYKLHVPTLCIHIQGGGVSPLEKFGKGTSTSMPFVKNNCGVLTRVIPVKPSSS